MVGQKSKVLWKIPNELFGQPNAIYLPVCFPYPGNPKHTIGVFLEYIVAEKKIEKKKSERGLPWWSSDKASALQCRRRGFDPWLGN